MKLFRFFRHFYTYCGEILFLTGKGILKIKIWIGYFVGWHNMDTDLMLNANNIKNKIYLIRGLHVMLDKDLATLYEVKSIRLREQVKRNIKRFPSDFMFKLNGEEVGFLVSQNAIPSKKYLGGYLPYVFTEQELLIFPAFLQMIKQ